MTPTEQKIAEAAGKLVTPEARGGFTMGANYALTELLEGELENFLRWLPTQSKIYDTTAELVQEYLKKKQ